MAIKVGDRAPEFSLPASTGGQASLEDFLGKKTLVLYFYPKDDTVGCTAEACDFRDNHGLFTAAGADVIGVSSDTLIAHEQFATKLRLPFTLLSDVDGRVRDAYGVRKTFGLVPGRVTYVIDRTGIVRYIFSSQLRFSAHVQKALEIVKTLEPPPSAFPIADRPL